jgi:hypothetical protein
MDGAVRGYWAVDRAMVDFDNLETVPTEVLEESIIGAVNEVMDRAEGK